MENLQLVLSVLGAIAIIAVLVHGFWSIRRQQPKSYKETPIADLYTDKKRDPDGFDADGIGEVRVRKASETEATAEAQQDTTVKVESTETSAETESFSLSDSPIKKAPKTRHEPSITSDESETIEQMELGLGQAPQAQPQPSLFEDPVVNRKPEKIKTAAPQSSQSQTSEPQPQANQPKPVETEVDIEPQTTSLVSQPLSGDAEVSSAGEEKQEETLAEPKDVLVLHVVAKEGEELNGAELLPSLLTLNFKFGDMDIFHRHEDNAGTGKVLFSLANMVKPGIFNPDEMEQFTTQGVVLFMTIPCYGDPLMNFSNMLNSAHQIADDLGGELLDGGRENWNEQKKQAYLQRIRALI
ncbi:cell division protein ZipA [Shewanella sp. Isolate11]|uniref:cell division protein ZipA n=1 Tax=Shewanella sp. Isolate11 TaxID=2908530 RepID=UPI001EFEC83A|nr:cell division protein ZipA [Shewanella sp. Isolate11]MCG9696335.1 cell division protein ZipA [Shewanella sp. Isolate11]